jgi:putative SOS response-associated peptidase YedK
MCGRFTLRASGEELMNLFAQAGLSVDPLPVALVPRYNIAPSQPLLAVRPRAEGAGMEQTFLSWGLIPSWSKDPNTGYKAINARSETVAEKPSFRAGYKYRRCLLPADGFYEWQKQGRSKQPWLIAMADGSPFCFAALWERWERHGSAIESCTLLTTEPNELVAPIHNRMPVILHPEDYATWLDRTNQKAEGLAHLLRPFPAASMSAHPVSPLVNNPQNDVPACVAE